MSHYVRQNQLTVVALANFDPSTNRAHVEQYGERLIYKKFAPFFQLEKAEVLVEPLRESYKEVTSGVADMSVLGGKPAKQAMIDSLRSYEESHPELCSVERASDLFYGVEKARGKLQPFIQWIYVPAVKDASKEGEEAGNTALGKLLQRTVRQKIDFDEDIEKLREETRIAYDALLEKEQDALKGLSENLAKKLAVYSHPDTDLSVEWLQGSEKSVSIADPKATVRAKEGAFKGTLARFGNGLQRSFLLAILQELASLEGDSSDGEKEERPTLILACEEPELYQHPPQARHLAKVLHDLTESGHQIMLTTHSAYFVSGDHFEEIRLVRKSEKGKCIKQASFASFADRIASATGKKPDKPSVAQAKLFAALQPELAEMFFCRKLVLVEGREDYAYLTSALMLENKWEEFRHAGLHIVPAGRKSAILQLLTIAQEFEIPVYVVFDADGDVKGVDHIHQHELDNASLLSALSVKSKAFPNATIFEDVCVVWSLNIEEDIKSSLGVDEWIAIKNKAQAVIDPGAGLKKNPIFIAECLRVAWESNKKPPSLTKLVQGITNFAAA